MKILMIGGTGIISSEICSLSIERGHDVTIVNRGKRKSLMLDKNLQNRLRRKLDSLHMM